MDGKPANENTRQNGAENTVDAENTEVEEETPANNSPAEEGAPEDGSQNLAQNRRDTILRLMEALQKSEAAGTPSRIVHETLLALSISLFVGSLGREGAALLVERLPDKIRSGEFGEGVSTKPE